MWPWCVSMELGVVVFSNLNLARCQKFSHPPIGWYVFFYGFGFLQGNNDCFILHCQWIPSLQSRKGIHYPQLSNLMLVKFNSLYLWNVIRVKCSGDGQKEVQYKMALDVWHLKKIIKLSLCQCSVPIHKSVLIN